MRLIFSVLLSLFVLPLQALPQLTLCGRADAGPAYLHIDVLEEEEITQRLDMFGVRADGTFLFFKDSGLAIKPTITGAWGDGDLLGYGVGLGYYIPFCGEYCYLVPVAGLAWTELKTDVDLEVFTGLQPPFPSTAVLDGVDEKFFSNSRYLGFEVMCKVCDSFWTTFIYQYAWADSKTYLTDERLPGGKQVIKGSTSGSNFALSFDYYLNNFSIGLAGGINSSLDEGRSGIRGYGVKLSFGYCL